MIRIKENKWLRSTKSETVTISVVSKTHHDGSFHLAVISGVVSSVSQQPQLAFFRYKPAGELSVPV